MTKRGWGGDDWEVTAGIVTKRGGEETIGRSLRWIMTKRDGGGDDWEVTAMDRY